MSQRPQKISSQSGLDDLIKKVKGGYPLQCFVLLNFGARSSKDISLNENNDYHIYNEIDDSEEIIVHSQLMSTFIGEAISKGALYKY